MLRPGQQDTNYMITIEFNPHKQMLPLEYLL